VSLFSTIPTPFKALETGDQADRHTWAELAGDPRIQYDSSCEDRGARIPHGNFRILWRELPATAARIRRAYRLLPSDGLPSSG